MRLQRCRRGSLVHVYQRTVNGYLLFYTARDCLTFFTIFSTRAKKHPLRIVSLCLMPDHIHFCAEVERHEDLAAFISEYSSIYSREFNKLTGGSGHLFKQPYGMANKLKDKSRRTCIIYILNNPVEKKLSKRALDYRWNYLKYAFSDYPFSCKPQFNKTTVKFRSALKMIKIRHAKGLYLNYNMLENLTNGLSGLEKEQFADFVIQTYTVINFEQMSSYFKTLESLVIATDSTTGSEYEIFEEKNTSSDKAYARISQFLINSCGFADPKDSLRLEEGDKIRIANRIFAECIATPLQICKYLHITKFA